MSAICGFLVALIIMLGIPASIILLIIFAIKKKGVKIPLFCLGGCVILIIILSLVGTYSWTKTDEYQDYLARIESEEIKEEETVSQENSTVEESMTEESTKQEEITEDKASVETETQSVDVEFSEAIEAEIPAETEESYKNKSVESEKQEAIDYLNIEISEKYLANFIHACESCGINPKETKNFEKLDDWFSGERYSFYYDGGTHDVYTLDNGEISSINYRQDSAIKLYEYGYESLNINDFTLDTSVISSMQVAAESVVKMSLNYPDTANFDWWTTGTYARYYDYYIIQAEFSAKNAFGMKDRHIFRIDCSYDEENGSKLVYYELDGVAQAGTPNIPDIKKIPISNLQESDSKEIVLTDGGLGDYGQEDDFSGYKVIRYYIPAGKYLVTCETRGSGFYVETIEKHIEDGYETSEIVQQFIFSNTEEKYEVEIKEGECVSLILNSILEFESLTE